MSADHSRLLDCHVHATVFTGTVPDTILRPPLTKRWVPAFLRRQLGIAADSAAPEERYLERLSAELVESHKICGAVLLASDGRYDEAGKLDRARTRFMIGNDYVLDAAERYPELLPGVSINPARADALDELERCRARGAVLVKVLPNVQDFDPADHRYVPFYRKMHTLGVPLLAHCGYEFTLPASNQALGDPDRLTTALEAGVTVILAHGGSTGILLWEKYFPAVRRLAATYDRLYLDTSALSLPSRAGTLLRLRRHPELAQRCLFGTDYPIPIYTFPFIFGVSRRCLKRIRREKNYFDRYALLLEACGLELNPEHARRLFNLKVTRNVVRYAKKRQRA